MHYSHGHASSGRMRSFLLAAAFVLLVNIPGARASAIPVTADVGAVTFRADVLPRTTVGFPGGVIATPNVEYANLAGFRPLFLDIYRQAGDANGHLRPLVVYVHGGGWRHGD